MLPIYGYFVAYTFESTYLGNLGIPQDFVQINISSVFFITVILLLLSALLFGVAAIFRPLLNKFKINVFIYPIIFCGLLLSLVFSFGYIFPPDNLNAFVVVAIIGSIYLILDEFVKPILKFKTLNNYKNNVLKLRKIKFEQKKNNITFSKDSYSNLMLIIFLLLICTYLITAYIAGTYLYNYNNFLVFQRDNKSYALIRNYSNEKIAIRYKNDKLIPGDVYLFSSDGLYLSSKKLNVERKNQNTINFIFFRQYN